MYKMGTRNGRKNALVDAQRYIEEMEKSIRADAVSRSRRTLRGQLVEHWVPFMAEANFDPRDARFLGHPIDYVIFDGASDGEWRKIIFLEVKSGTAQLNKNERELKRLVDEGRVEFQVFRVSEK